MSRFAEWLRTSETSEYINDEGNKIGYREVPVEEFRHSEKYLIITPKPDGKPCVIVVMPDAAFIVSRLGSAIEIWTEALTTAEGYMLADLFLNFLKDKEAFREELDKIFSERVNEGGSVAGISSLNELNEALDEISSYAGKYSLDIYNYTCDVGDVVIIPSLLSV